MAVATNLNTNQVANRRQQEEISYETADDRDSRAGQRFLLDMTVLAVPVGFEQQRGQGRTQRQGIERTDNGRCGNGESKLFKELSADAGHKCRRHEHGT